MGIFDDLIPAPTAGRFDDLIPQAARPDMGMGSALAAGLREGVTANFSDELAGGQAASRAPPVSIMGVPVSSIAGLMRVGLDRLTGGTEATSAYEKARDAERQQIKAAHEQYPITTTGGSILGGAILPIGGAASAATLPARMGRSALVGAGYGAASGAGGGENLTDRAIGAGVGAGVGGAAGALAPPLVEGVTNLATKSIGLPAAARTVRGAINPENEAARRTATAIQRDTQAGAAGLSPAEFEAARAAGLPVANVDLGGEATRALARSAANTSPEGRAALETLANDRFAGQSDRAATFIDNLFGGNVNAGSVSEALKSGAQAANRANYGKAFQEGAQGLWSPELERLASSDAVSGAMQRAAKAAKDEAIVGGGGAFNPRVTFTADGRMQLARGPNGTPTYPDLQYWDLVRRELSDGAQRAGYGTSEARRLNNFAGKLNEELDRIVPSYKEARGGASAAFGAQDALEAGANFVGRRMTTAEGASALAKMSDPERQLFKVGFASKLMDDLKNTRDGVNVLNKIGQSPEARGKLNIVLGQDGRQALDGWVAVEQAMDKLRVAVKGNSTTARQLIEAGVAGGVGFEANALLGGNHLDPMNVVTGALAAGLTGGKFKVDQRVARRVAEMLTSHDPAVYAQGVKKVASNQTLTRALRSLDFRGLTAGSRALQGPTGARANEEQK